MQHMFLILILINVTNINLFLLNYRNGECSSTRCVLYCIKFSYICFRLIKSRFHLSLIPVRSGGFWRDTAGGLSGSLEKPRMEGGDTDEQT